MGVLVRAAAPGSRACRHGLLQGGSRPSVGAPWGGFSAVGVRTEPRGRRLVERGRAAHFGWPRSGTVVCLDVPLLGGGTGATVTDVEAPAFLATARAHAVPYKSGFR